MKLFLAALFALAGSIFCQVTLGRAWQFYGDSETDGRADATPSAVSQVVVFRNIWNSTFPENQPLQVYATGESGCSMLETMARYGARSDCGSATWVHFQESGNQDKDGQRTPADYSATLRAFILKLRDESPNSVISMETAYSFQRESIAYRNWGPYNTALKQTIAQLAGEGVVVPVAEADAAIKILVDSLGFSNAITGDGGHFLGVGNLLVALAMFDALGHTVDNLNLDGIPDAEISVAHKALSRAIINGLHGGGSRTGKKGSTPDVAIRIAPNPCNLGARITVCSPMASDIRGAYVEIYSIHGKFIQRVPADASWNALGMPAGMYIFKAFVHGRSAVEKAHVLR